jgi:hypothetical protein
VRVGPVGRQAQHRPQLAVARHRRPQRREVLARVRRADEQHVRAALAARRKTSASTP